MPLDIEVKENTFKLTLYSEMQVTPQATVLEIKIINIIKKDNKISIRAIAELLETTYFSKIGF